MYFYAAFHAQNSLLSDDTGYFDAKVAPTRLPSKPKIRNVRGNLLFKIMSQVLAAISLILKLPPTRIYLSCRASSRRQNSDIA